MITFINIETSLKFEFISEKFNISEYVRICSYEDCSQQFSTKLYNYLFTRGFNSRIHDPIRTSNIEETQNICFKLLY